MVYPNFLELLFDVVKILFDVVVHLNEYYLMWERIALHTHQVNLIDKLSLKLSQYFHHRYTISRSLVLTW